jgi:hypothetical protein
MLGNFTHQLLKGQFVNQEIRRLLVATNFAKGNGSGAVTMGLPDTTSRWSGLAGGLLLSTGQTEFDNNLAIVKVPWLR